MAESAGVPGGGQVSRPALLDAEALYAEVQMPYRHPDTANDPPEVRSHKNLGRIEIPQRPGACSNWANGNKASLTPVQMLDGRKLEQMGEQMTLDGQGFALVEDLQPTKVQNWEDLAELRDVYFPEVEALVRKHVPGADDPRARVLVYDHALRTGGSALKEALASPDSSYGPYGAFVHCDNTIRSLHAKVKDWVLGTNDVVEKYGGKLPPGWGEVYPSREWQRRLFRAETEDHNSPEGEGGEHLIVNVWKPLVTVENWGLGLLDGRSMDPNDVHCSLLQNNGPPGGLSAQAKQAREQLAREGTAGDAEEEGVGGGDEELPVKDLDGHGMEEQLNELLTPIHDPNHRWIYFPEMQPNESLLLKIQDSRRDGRTRTHAHAAFRDPRGKAGAHRASIEVRTCVILPRTSSESSISSKL